MRLHSHPVPKFDLVAKLLAVRLFWPSAQATRERAFILSINNMSQKRGYSMVDGGS
jgi:hypothetical protein